MKEILMEWMMNIAVFSLIVSVAVKLIPGKSYLPFIRLFAGFVTILLFLEPLLSILGLNEKLFDKITKNMYEMEINQMETDLIAIEERQKERMEQIYKESLMEQNNKENLEEQQ